MIEKVKTPQELLLEIKAEHKRLQALLATWAKKNKYQKPCKLSDELIPDVCFMNEKGTVLFIGDAKDSKQETPSNQKSCERIKNYLDSLSNYVTLRKVKSGFLIVATNTKEAAVDWEKWFHKACKDEQNKYLIKIKSPSSITHITILAMAHK